MRDGFPPDDSRERPPASGRFALRSMRRVVVTLSLGFAAALTAMAWVTEVLWLGKSFGNFFAGHAVLRGMLTGAGFALVAAVVAVGVVVRAPGLAGFRRLVHEGFEGVEPRVVDLLLISLGAGWGEELFFRGVLQPRIGIVLASVAFVVVHGVHRARTMRGRLMLGAFLFAASTGLGALSSARGLAAAMAAHATYDFAVLMAVRALIARGRWHGAEAPGRADAPPR
jgi:membrane protease YdiL (CAAX protease family)